MGGDCHRAGSTGGVILERENSWELIVTEIGNREKKVAKLGLQLQEFDWTENSGGISNDKMSITSVWHYSGGNNLAQDIVSVKIS